MIDLKYNKVKWEKDGGKMKNKDLHKYMVGFILGILVLGSLSVYAVTAVIQSSEVSYNNKVSGGRSENVQGSIDELYERSGVMKDKWTDPILHGTDPVFDEKEELIPVEIGGKGTVKYANLKTKWYCYEEKRWANAVILNSTGKEKKYKTGDTIKEEDIESYFVWIPRYKYKIWNLGNYTSLYRLVDLKDSLEAAETESALRHITGKVQLIDIVFQNKEEKTTNTSGECEPDSKSAGGDNCHVGDYMTHPAFTLGTTELNGIWVGKFEIGGDENNIVVKPNVVSWMNATVGTFWNKLYNYKRDLNSHMMKNTEWGAVAYLSHSIYGIGREVNINNNSEYKTGYSAAANTDQSTSPGISGTGTDVTQPWNTTTGYLASTTGNITGVYDMSGGATEYMAAYVDGQTGFSGLTSELTNATYTEYFDKYSTSSRETSYNNRILGDATGEMGPFYKYYDKDKLLRDHNAWYADTSFFVTSGAPWFYRGGYSSYGVLSGQFDFVPDTGDKFDGVGSRLVIAI